MKIWALLAALPILAGTAYYDHAKENAYGIKSDDLRDAFTLNAS